MLAGLERALTMLPAFEDLAVLTLRSAALLVLGWLAAHVLARSLPSARQALWTSVLVGLLALPVLTATLPAWRVLPSVLAPGLEPRSAAAVELRGLLPPRSAAELPAARTNSGVSAPRFDWAEWAVLLWAGGAMASGLFLALGLGRLRRLSRAAEPASPSLCRELAVVARAFGVRRPVRALISTRVASPATWGLWRPLVVLPPAAVGWDGERLRLVLAHEMAHVARGDWGWRLVARFGCVVYWFNPLVWIAAGRLRFEQELACDLAVVERGARPSVYADHLLEIARAGAADRALPLVALDMARRSQMEGRLMSILADRPARRLRRGLLLPALSIAAALPVVASIQPQAPPAVSTPAPVPTAAPAPPAPEEQARALELEALIAAKAEDIEALVEPIQEEVEQALDEVVGDLLEEMKNLELDMRPGDEEMSRIGEEISRRMMETLPAQVEIERLAQRAESIALEMAQRSLATQDPGAELEPLGAELEELQRELLERQRPLEDIHEAMAPYREQMESLRQSMEPLRERMDAIHRQLEPRREQMERLREERMAEVRERLDVLQTELEALTQELRERSGNAQPKAEM